MAVIAALTEQIDQLQAVLGDRFEQHPDAAIYRSLPGLGEVLGARVLGEFGDDPDRYADARAHRNYAGTSPITKPQASRAWSSPAFHRNRRLADALTW